MKIEFAVIFGNFCHKLVELTDSDLLPCESLR